MKNYISRISILFLVLLPLSLAAQNGITNSQSAIEVGRDLLSVKQYDSAIVYFEKAVKLSIEEINDNNKTIAQSELGRSWIYLNKYDEAQKMSEAILRNEKSAIRAKIIAHQNIGLIYAQTTKNTSKESFHNHKALRIAADAPLTNFDNSLSNDSIWLSNKMLALESLAFMHRESQNHDSTEYYLSLLIDLSTTSNKFDTYHQALYKSDLANVFINQRKLNEAKKTLLSTQPLIDKLPLKDQRDFNLSATFYNFLGAYHSIAGQIDSSLIAKRKQQEIMSISPRLDSVLLARTQSYIGIDYYRLGDLNQAWEYEQKAFALKKRILASEDPEMARSYKLLGLYRLRQNFAGNDASEYFKENLRINEKLYGKLDTRTVDAMHHMSIGYNTVGKYKESLKISQEALSIQKKIKGSDYVTGAIYTAIAHNLTLLERLPESISVYTEMIDLLNNSKEDLSVLNINSRTGLASIYMRLNDYPKAEKYLREAEEFCIRTYGSESYSLVSIYNQISHTLQMQGQFDEALEANQKAIKSNSYRQDIFNTSSSPLSLLAKSQVDYVDSHIIRSKLLFQKEQESKNHNFKEFWDTFGTSVDLFKSWVLEQSNSVDVISLQSYSKDIYSVGIDALWFSDSINERSEQGLRMWNFSENSKAINQKLTEKKRQVTYPLESTSQIQEKQKTIDKAISHYKSLALNGNEHDSVAAGLFRALQAKKDSEQELKAQFPKDYSLTQFESDLTKKQVKGFLNQNQTILDYFITEQNLYAFVINTDSIHSFKFNWTSELQNEILSLKGLVNNDSVQVFKSMSKSVYQKIFQPLESAIAGDNIIVIPDKDLWNLNFDLLITNSEDSKVDYLIQKYAISYSYSSALLFSNNVHRKSKKQVLAFAYAETDIAEPKIDNMRDGPKENLPGTAKELKNLEASLDGKFYYGKKASEGKFKQAAPSYAIIHLALHGEVSDEEPDNSKLHFTKSEELTDEDNALHTFELYDMKLNADLAVLSACNTGTGKVSDGEGIMSLGKAFRYAGVNSVLLSQWEVSDATTPIIMNSFYDNLKKGLNKPEALRQAKLKFLENSNNITSNPYYWGSFFILGNPDPIDLSPRGNQRYWVFALLILTVLIVSGKVFTKRMGN